MSDSDPPEHDDLDEVTIRLDAMEVTKATEQYHHAPFADAPSVQGRWLQTVAAASSPGRPDPMRIAPGGRVGHYILISRIAHGGMATVWLAKRERGGQSELVALKIVLPHLAGDSSFVKMFLDEVKLLAAIRHPNVVDVRDVGSDGGYPYAALEWIDGDSLARLMAVMDQKGLRMPLAIALRIVGEVCLGLHIAHELRGDDGELLDVVHRDVSPPNILLSATGDVKLIDFGVAKAVERISEQTRSGVFKGKVAYMAPEQAERKPIDRRTDIWSVGVVLYKLVTGETPYAGGLVDVFQKLKRGDKIPPLPKNTPRMVAEVITRALQRDNDQRFQTAAEMRRAIQFAYSEEAVTVSKDEFALFVRQHLGEMIKRRRTAALEALEQ